MLLFSLIFIALCGGIFAFSFFAVFEVDRDDNELLHNIFFCGLLSSVIFAFVGLTLFTEATDPIRHEVNSVIVLDNRGKEKKLIIKT